MRRFNLAGGVFFLIALAICGCQAPEMVRVKMDYTPTNLVLPPKSFPQTPIFIDPFEDKRKTRDQIGENIETPQNVPIKADPAEILASLENAYKKEFKKVGLNIVESRNAASRILRVSVLNLWVQKKIPINRAWWLKLRCWINPGKNFSTRPSGPWAKDGD